MVISIILPINHPLPEAPDEECIRTMVLRMILTPSLGHLMMRLLKIMALLMILTPSLRHLMISVYVIWLTPQDSTAPPLTSSCDAT